MHVNVNNVDFHVNIAGKEDAPWVTFGHSLAANSGQWDEQVELLKNDYHLLCYDQRGHGGSSAPPGPYTFDLLIDDVIGIWAHLGIDKSHWVGLSIGGMIGYGLAINHPDRLLSLTACDSRPDAPTDYKKYFQYRINTAREKGMEGLVDATIERWYTEKSQSNNLPVLDKIRDMIRTTNTVGHEGCCEALKTLAFGSRLNEISAPTLIIGGAEDKGAPPEALAEAAERIPNAKHVVIDHAGHISNTENPEQFNQALQTFLRHHS